jgi:hypothetical protein
MRHLSLDEVQAVGGASCGDLTVTVGLFNGSISGSFSDWLDCLSYGRDLYNSFMAHVTTGIRYGEPHVG